MLRIGMIAFLANRISTSQLIRRKKMDAVFYKTDDDRRHVPKKLTNEKSIDIRLKEEDFSIINPVIFLSGTNFVGYNYVYISKFKRYYFVENVKTELDSLITLELSVDVLQSYWDNVKNVKCVIERQENLSSPYFVDSMMPIRSDSTIDQYVIGRVGGEYRYYITTAGGVL